MTEPKIIISPDFIEIMGHYDNNILCAKMTLLCNIFAISITDGYAKLPNNNEVKSALHYINTDLIFSCDAGGGCSSGCWGCSGCGGGCSDGCGGGCSWCSGCGDGCTGGCSGGCSGCSGCGGCGGCSGCSGSCSGSCDGCSGSCSGNCTNTCNGCTNSCDNGCTSESNAAPYEKVKQIYADLIAGKVIFASDFTALETLLINEVKRRKKEPGSNTAETIGSVVESNAAKKVDIDFTNIGKTFTEVIDTKNPTLAKTLQAYMQTAIELYETQIPSY